MSLDVVDNLNIQQFLNKVNAIRVKAGISKIFIFIDEYSDLSEEEQEKFSTLFQKFLGSKINMFLRLA
ncbi:hypothetical protein ACT7DA_24495 [Bacillus pacificus]